MQSLALITAIACACVGTSMPGVTGPIRFGSRVVPDHARPTVDVVVSAPPDASDTFVCRIVSEADAIWARAGVVFTWRRMRAGEAAAPGSVVVAIHALGSATDAGELPLGWIFFADHGPSPWIHLSRHNAEILMRHAAPQAAATDGARELLLARALGRALAHELGHYLLRSNGHTRTGLMRAARPFEEFLGLSRARFGISEQERAGVASSPAAGDPALAGPRPGRRPAGQD